VGESLAREFPRWEPLGPSHDRAAFSCPKHPELESFLKLQASQQARRKIAATTVMLVDDDTRIAGYYTLSSARIDAGELPPDVERKFPKYSEGIPATLIGRLAVDAAYLGKGWGARLLMNALDTAHAATEQVASAFVIVRAVDDDAFRFYSHYGFIAMPSDPRRLFLPMRTIAKLPQARP
jgi:predicted GNAT family N-acyltransferase